MTTTFESAKLGDLVYSVEFGWGEVGSIDIRSETLGVIFIDNCLQTYGFDGKSKTRLARKNQTLFWREIKIEAPVRPPPVIAVDAKVYVWNCGDEIKNPRHFAKIDGDKVCTYAFGRSSFTRIVTDELVTWDNFAIAE